MEKPLIFTDLYGPWVPSPPWWWGKSGPGKSDLRSQSAGTVLVGSCRYMLAHEGFLENLWGNMYVIHFLFVSTMYDVLKSWYFAFLANQKQQNSRDVLQYRLCNQGASDRFPLFQRHRWGSWQRSCKKLEVLQGERWTSIQWDYLVCGMFTLALSVYLYMHT